ncbi:MAG: VOC family protein [Clostridiales Family XIII bacterium]|jgi:hypothetical protein|nr:VOC family protein [Clostridiales Family XIII bacterium]
MGQKPLFDKIAQVSIVVDDIRAYIRRYNDEYGIGPWKVLHFTPENTRDMVVAGQPEGFAMYLGLCDSLNIQLELIQPLSENGDYAEFLKKHGPGIHHICLGSADGYEGIQGRLAERGCVDTLLGGMDSGGMAFAYVDLTKELGFIAELVDPPADFVSPPPAFLYPEK